jgi:rhomboid protease GluP
MSETFATYLARQFEARKGCTPGTVPEAAALVSASDIVLTRSDGVTFSIICLIDCEANPTKRFALSRDAVDEIGKQCLKYTGTVNRQKMPVSIQIMEVGRDVLTDENRERLKPLKRRSIFSKVMSSAWLVDTSANSVWTNLPLNGLFGGRLFIERLMGKPRQGDAQMQQSVAVGDTDSGWPLASGALLAILIGIFIAEHVYGIGPWSGLLSPSVTTLAAFGGLNRQLVFESGEWFRIFTGPLLHGDVMHLLMNGLALVLAGAALENLVGRVWYVALFVIGAVFGSLASLAFNGDNVISVGASGGITALLTAAFICSTRLPFGPMRTQVQFAVLRMLIPALIPLATPGVGAKVDFAAHLGGAVGGALAGALLLLTWRAASPKPRFTAAAAAVVVVALAATALAYIPLTQRYPSYALPAESDPG